MSDSITLHQIGDHELWYAEGQDGSWMLPILVEWRYDKDNDKHYALVQPAISPYYRQLLTLQALFEHHDILKESRKWIISRKVCEALLKKAPGITAARYYKWPDADCPPMPPRWTISLMGVKWQQTEHHEVADDFVNHISNRSNLPSSVIAVVWKAICKETPEWMLENKRALDMGFCQLVAFPFRLNWKEIVAFKGKRLGIHGIFKSDNQKLHENLDAVGFPNLVCNPHNIGMRHGKGNKRITYTLEALQTRQFEVIADAVEKQRLSCGKLSYVAHFEETVEKLYSFVVRSMAIYYQKTSQAFAKVHVSRATGNASLVSVGGKSLAKQGTNLIDLPKSIVRVDKRFDLTSETGDMSIICDEADEVPKVSTVLQAADDVRECSQQPDMGEQGFYGNNGVPLPHASQGVDTGKPMLVEPETSGPGVDTTRDRINNERTD